MDDVNKSMNKSDDILNSLNKEKSKQEKEKETSSDEGIELEERQQKDEEKRRKSQANLNEIVDQISVSFLQRFSSK